LSADNSAAGLFLQCVSRSGLAYSSRAAKVPRQSTVLPIKEIDAFIG